MKSCCSVYEDNKRTNKLNQLKNQCCAQHWLIWTVSKRRQPPPPSIQDWFKHNTTAYNATAAWWLTSESQCSPAATISRRNRWRQQHKSSTAKIGYVADNPVCGVSESYRGGQPKLLWSELSWWQPAVTSVENKNITGKLTAFSYCPAWTHFNGDNMGCFIETWSPNNDSIVLLIAVVHNWNCDYLNQNPLNILY